MNLCKREDCFAYNNGRENNCNCLVTTYDNKECPFYKKSSEVDMKQMKKDLESYTSRRCNLYFNKD